MSVWDGEKVHDLAITWSRGHDQDARVLLPAKFKKDWRAAVELLREDEYVEPYSTLPIRVPTSKLNTTATGIYAVAHTIFGPGADWKVWPPYETPTPIEEGDDA